MARDGPFEAAKTASVVVICSLCPSRPRPPRRAPAAAKQCKTKDWRVWHRPKPIYAKHGRFQFGGVAAAREASQGAQEGQAFFLRVGVPRGAMFSARR